MPKFPKNTDYKMKGSTFYGRGNQSPLKIDDSAVIKAQEKLDHVELDFREPGWTKIARGVVGGVKSVLSCGKKKGGSKTTTPEVETNAEITEENTEYKDDQGNDIMAS